MTDAEFDSFVRHLLNVGSAQQSSRESATAHLQSLILENKPKALELSVRAISLGGGPSKAIAQSLLIIKAILTPTHSAPLPFLQGIWGRLPLTARETTQCAVISGLLFDDLAIRCVAAHDIALIGALNSRIGGWSMLLASLVELIQAPASSMMTWVGCLIAFKELVLQAQLYWCVHQLFDYSGLSIFCELFVHLFERPDVPPNEFLEILECFSTVFEVCGAYFADVNARNALIILASTKLVSGSRQIHYLVYKLIGAIFRRFYGDIHQNMKEIIVSTMKSLAMADADFVVPALDFWREAAKYERSIQKRRPDCYQKIIETAAEALIPVFLGLLTRIPADEVPLDGDAIGNWEVPHEAADALRALAVLVPGQFERLVSNGLTMVESQDWQTRAGGFSALLSAIHGGYPNAAHRFFVNNFSLFVDRIEDSSVSVRCTAISLASACLSEFPELCDDITRMLAMLEVIHKCRSADVASQVLSTDLLRQFVKARQNDTFQRECKQVLAFMHERLM
jgi:hypothetical protein